VADTGSPWFIPYAEPTDLVRDWPDLSEDVADAVAAGLDAAGSAGIGSNVVQAIKTDTFTTSSNTYVTVTGLSAVITPTTNTSKVLVIVDITSGPAFDASHFRIARGGSPIYVGDAASNRVQAAFGGYWGQTGAVANHALVSSTIVFLDSPGTISPTTYTVETRRGGGGAGTVYVNRSVTDTDNADSGRGSSSITVIEVAP
jgi:hypothetical protein